LPAAFFCSRRQVLKPCRRFFSKPQARFNALLAAFFTSKRAKFSRLLVIFERIFPEIHFRKFYLSKVNFRKWIFGNSFPEVLTFGDEFSGIHFPKF